MWRNCDSVQHNKKKVLLFPLRLIMKRVELVAVNFLLFFYKSYCFFSLPYLFLLDFWEDSVFAVSLVGKISSFLVLHHVLDPCSDMVELVDPFKYSFIIYKALIRLIS